MKHDVTRILLTVLTVILAVVLVGLLGLAGVLILKDAEPAHSVPTLQTQPSQTTVPTTQPTTAPTTAPTTVPTTVPEETTEPTTAPTEPPEPEVFTLSFAGDCTLGNHVDKTGPYSFIGTVGDNYAYPFADVQEWFATDDCTFVNLECALTDGGTPNLNKKFTFKGPARYTAILTEGSVEFANVVNNHAKDYGTSGYKDTLANLDAVNVYYAEEDDTRVFTTESGLTIGVYASYFPTSTWGVSKRIEAMRAEGAEIIIVAVHWGEEYDYHPNSNEKKMGHQFIDAGADIVWGHHPHVLQDIEEYNGGIIYYSLGNFSFGGNSSPSDKDTAIIQQQIVREPDGTVHLGEMTIIPCHVSGILSWGNDYQPTPMEVGSKYYDRVMSKLDGSFELEGADVPYRDDLNKDPTTAPTEPEETIPDTTVPEETVPGTTVPEETVPDTTVPEETAPETTEPTPTEPTPTEPIPTEPIPTEPEATEPAPTEPQPSETT